MSNPLLEYHPLPPFERITVEHIIPAISQRIEDVFTILENQLKVIEEGTPPSWDNLVAPFEEASDLLNQSWSPVQHLNSVKNSDELRHVYETCLKKITAFNTAIDQHEPLYRAYKRLVDSEHYQQLTTPQQRVIEQALRDFHLAGIALPEADKQRYGDIKKRLSALSNQFSNNVLDATQVWLCQFDSAKALAGLPETELAAAKQTAQQKQLEGYVVTLDMPSYLAVMTYADDRALREKTYRAFVTRASQESDADKKDQWDNTAIIEEILALRHELACLLGFANYAELSLATKMANTPQQVTEFLYDLVNKSLPAAKKDLQELTNYAKNSEGIETLEAWDIAYYSEKLRQEKYTVSQEALRAYFPAERVLEGLFSVVNRLFGIIIETTHDIEKYHDDIHLYRIEKNQQTIAYFYLDMYARDKKRGGAWMADCRTRRLRENTLQLPVAFLTCNFSPPVGDTPSLLTHQEVTTLFHEFGHGLHHMLTQMTDAAVSGISGVAWDAVELPSQFLENWCWEKSVIPMISCHYQTGEPLPERLLEKMLTAKNFQSGMQMLRQIEFALFDMLIHEHYDPKNPVDVQTTLDQVRKQVAVTIPPECNKFQNSFKHIFAGGYAAGYYSYKWAEVLSADAFSLFEEKGIFDKTTSEKFLTTILASGGSQKPMDLFIAFRGRRPETDALLRHSGL
ncbi:oligopeptidase A [Candidatus Endobugula sertula]|uniref:oligopeptidase A n=1 Tax=Candidatus Endobugula sertula TaxID=62101 RepID=A0A1D2QRB0_9GAMM|nr:oligopeptidase A [Candidatus Endobugula sertula]